MHRRFLAIASLLTILTAGVIASTADIAVPAASATPTTTVDAPIGKLGDTLRVEYDSDAYGALVADVTVHDVVPAPIPPGWGYNGAPRWRAQGGAWRANVTIHVIKAPTPYTVGASTTFNGVAPGADSYVSKHTDLADSLDMVLTNAPAGSTVDGGVFWDVYRGLVTNILMLSRVDGHHLAQWNM